MQLGRYQISTLQPTAVHSISFSEDYQHFSVASDGGYEIWKTWPLGLVRRRCELSDTQTFEFIALTMAQL